MMTYPFSQFKAQANIAKQTCKELDRMYQYVFKTIKEAKQKSIETNKPLLVLFGERHYSLFSSLAELVTISAAVQLGFTRFCVELDNFRLDNCLMLLDRYLENNKVIDNEISLATSGEFFNKDYLYYLLIFHKLSISPEPIDHGVTHLEGHIETFIKNGIKRRNTIMTNELCENRKDTLAIVGEYHLHGLTNDDSKLSDTFEVVQFGSMNGHQYDKDHEIARKHSEHLPNQLTHLFFNEDNPDVNIALFKAEGKNLDIHVRDYFLNLCKPHLTNLCEPQIHQEPQEETSLMKRCFTADKNYLGSFSKQDNNLKVPYKDSYDINKFLKSLRHDQHKVAILANKDKLSKLVKVSDDVKRVLNRTDLCIDERNAIFDEIKFKLPSLMIVAKDVNNVLGPLSEEQRAVIYIATKDKLPSLIKEAADVDNIFKHLSDEQRTEVYLAIKDRLPSLMKSAEEYDRVQKYLSTPQRAEMFTAIKDDILSITTLDSLTRFVSVLFIEQRSEIIAEFILKFSELINNFHDLKTVVRVLEPDNCSALFELIKHKLPILIEDQGQLDEISYYLDKEQVKIAQAAYDKQPDFLPLKRQMEGKNQASKRQKIEVECLHNAPALDEPKEVKRTESHTKRQRIRR